MRRGGPPAMRRAREAAVGEVVSVTRVMLAARIAMRTAISGASERVMCERLALVLRRPIQRRRTPPSISQARARSVITVALRGDEFGSDVEMAAASMRALTASTMARPIRTQMIHDVS